MHLIIGESGEHWGRRHCGWQSTSHPGTDMDHHTQVSLLPYIHNTPYHIIYNVCVYIACLLPIDSGKKKHVKTMCTYNRIVLNIYHFSVVHVPKGSGRLSCERIF